MSRTAVEAVRFLSEASARGFLVSWSLRVTAGSDPDNRALIYWASAVPRRRRADGVVPGYRGQRGAPEYTARHPVPEPALIELAGRVAALFPELTI